MKSVLNADKLKNHFIYSWWKYLIVLIAGTLGINFLYVVSEPRVPDNQKLEVIVCGSSLDLDFNVYMEQVCANEMPGILETDVTVIPDDETALQYLTVRIGTQGGDLYILPKKHFDTLSSNGALLPLENDKELLSILSAFNPEDFAWGTEVNSRDIHLYGISLKYLSGLNSFFWLNDGYLAVLRYGKNLDNAVEFLHILARDMKTTP